MDSDADIVTYLGDDDLFLPDHVETKVGLLQSHDLAHPFPVIFDNDGQPKVYPTDLADERCVQWHLQRGFNTIGLTGATHTVSLYRRLPDGWTEPPSGWWSYHYFWTQLFRQPSVRLATSSRCTVIKHPATSSDVTSDERRRTLVTRSARMESPGFGASFESMVAEAVRVRAVDEYRVQTLHERAMDDLEAQRRSAVERDAALSARLDKAIVELERMRTQLVEAQVSTAAAVREIETIRATRTWRLRGRLLASPVGNLARGVLARQGEPSSIG